jgi:Protein of unknown function (DUF2958)
MRLLSQELRENLPPLGSQRTSSDPMIYAKFWIPEVNWIWYVAEGQASSQGFKFFGYVIGLDEEWEEFSLRDLEVVIGPSGDRVRRDYDFISQRWSKLSATRGEQKEQG